MSTAAAGPDAEAEIILAERGRAGFARLNRPRALNALTLDMIGKLEAFYHRCAKAPHIYGIVLEGDDRAFCSGGDIRYVYDIGRDRPDEATRFYAEEYQHNWTLECFTKPSIALINGIVMGGGVGISLYGTHRVAGENTRFAMPETGIGFFPDVGAGWFLPRMPGEIGLYLGLTGTILGQADSFYVGFATHCIPSSRFEMIKAAMAEADPIDPILNDLHEAPGEYPLEALRPVIDRIFAAASVEEIVTRLGEEQGEWQDWARQTRETMLKRSPLSLKVTFEHLRRGATYRNLKDALIVEHRLTRRFMEEPDHYEGIRAAVIEKGHTPHWRHAALAEVSDAEVEAMFEPHPDGDLVLRDYWQLVD